ncbi:MAG TPA: efflux RND transporter periplasmic adaptor subunit [Rhodocyclaceae bacterium]|nr:efflux RND transporter periplasmic adaptor subunit [Rhodocyclaceae bacterium]
MLRLLVLCAMVCGGMSAVAARADDAVGKTRLLQWREIDATFPVEATVEAVRQATLSAQVAGQVNELRVDAGRAVKAGELLMRIDAREAAANEAGAQAQLAQARAAWERTGSLYARKFVSQAALDQAEAAWKAAQAQAQGAGAATSHTLIKAPFAAWVAQRHIELGETVTPGRPLLTLFDPKGLRVVANVPQHRLAELKQSLRARIELPESGRWIEATRIELLPTVDARSHTATARAYLPPNIEGIAPGMFVRAHFSVGQTRKLTVPPAAIIRRGEVTAVYAIDEQNTPRLRQVRLGETAADGEIEILAGLSGGERVSLTPVQTGMALKARR